MKSKIVGNIEKRGATQGNGKLGLITQRSKVQILPPQPTDSSATYIHFILRENRRYSRLGSRKSLIASDQFGDSTLGFVRAVVARMSTAVHRDRAATWADSYQVRHQFLCLSEIVTDRNREQPKKRFKRCDTRYSRLACLTRSRPRTNRSCTGNNGNA